MRVYSFCQCANDAGPPEGLLPTSGNPKAQAAVIANKPALAANGRDAEMAKSVPASTGARMPVNREIAADVPDAVPRISMSKVSGVMPYSTAYIAVPAALIIIELTVAAQPEETTMKANIAIAVRTVKSARLRRRPRLDSIEYAPTMEPGQPASE